MLLAERERYLRIVAGVPDGAKVDFLVKLPDDALIFPNPGTDFTAPRKPRVVTKEFARRARKLGFKKLRFHDLRGTHETLLLDRGVPVHVVATRCGHDPAALLLREEDCQSRYQCGFSHWQHRERTAELIVSNFVSRTRFVLVTHRAKCLILLQRKGGRAV